MFKFFSLHYKRFKSHMFPGERAGNKQFFYEAIIINEST